MAVVVSPGQNEISERKAKGFDIVRHRERMAEEDLKEKFKNPKDEFRLVFVCARWLTGFAAPSCSTLYSRQDDARPHADADHRPRQPGVWRQGERPDRRLREPSPIAGIGAALAPDPETDRKDSSQIVVAELSSHLPRFEPVSIPYKLPPRSVLPHDKRLSGEA
jgi:hypothetical protein